MYKQSSGKTVCLVSSKRVDFIKLIHIQRPQIPFQLAILNVSAYMNSLRWYLWELTLYPVVASQVYFFSVLEVGLACIAVNLPSLWYLASKITPEAALRSLRSIISLRSLRSTGSPSAVAKDTPHALNKTTYGGSSTSQAPISLTNLPADAHATYDVEAGGSQHAQESASATKTVS